MAHALTSQRLGLLASLLAVGASLWWLAFFIEHVADWFTRPELPPPFVWAAQLARLGILLLAWIVGRNANAQRLRA